MFEKRDSGHILMGQRIPRLTEETYRNAVEERRETLLRIDQSPGAWLIAAVAQAELDQLHEFALELGIISLPDNVTIDAIQ